MKSANLIPIPEKDLKRFEEPAARAVMQTVKWTPGRHNKAAKKDFSPDEEREVTIDSTSRVMSVILGNTALKIGQDTGLFSLDGLTLLHALRRGLTVGMFLSEQYQKQVGYDQLLALKDKGQLPTGRVTEFQQKGQTAAAIQVFEAAHYALWKLKGYKADEVSAVPMEMDGIPEVSLLNPPEATQCLVFYMERVLAAKQVQNGPGAIRMAQIYLQWVIDEIKLKAGAFAFTEPFIDNMYKLETEEFSVDGWEVNIGGGAPSAEFNPIEIGDIVGNHEAKRLAWRITQHLIAYDFQRKMNPLVELGAFSWIQMYLGKPGTGKTLLIRAVLTLVDRYCRALGLPFRCHMFPTDMGSIYQAGSAKNMQAWMNAFKNPNEIIVAPIDDAEKDFRSRTRQGASEAERGIISTFLVNTEGVGVIVRGNVIILFATNMPDEVDPAVMNRIPVRVKVGGAETVEDWMDNIGLWSKRIGAWGKDLVNLSWPDEYKFLSAQKIRAVAERGVERVFTFRDKRLVEIYGRVSSQYKNDDTRFYGHFYKQVEKEFPLFSMRDQRNMEQAVSARYFDFDFPDEWLKDRNLFVAKSYDEKKGLILEEQKKHIGDLKFSDIFFEEMVKYLNTTVEILDGGKQRRIDELAEEMWIQAQARSQTEERLHGKKQVA